ncbi:MAG: formate--tetrahydrofolate ligase [Candidatus Heimdallarchaeaceae archaeon]|uniref:formate--tetrahydrofolate ligase n=1 Tax=Candidatus Heimdallarchaeum endolithica TaxID=2876572 RepID=A0A9Y1BPZ1_9ARCH|nr:MAG: formate--tetrahydrofolate ligase [Candidatus Heimdallarchaeum endolithica]
MKPDIEISQEKAKDMKDIREIVKKVGLTEDDLQLYGKYIAKLNQDTIARVLNSDKEEGKLIFVTAMTASKAGEGKTVTSIGLSQAFAKLGKSVMFAIREPSMGPTFGIKGGATGGGYSQVYPMVDIDLHFTGDLHAITSAHNLLAALIDNHITKGNKLNIDPTKVTWPRALDVNDRALRNIITGLGGRRLGGDIRNTGFVITAASEIMAILALSMDMKELKERLGNILIGYTYDDKPVYAKDLNAVGAMALILKDAIKPNIVQNFEGVPGFIHCGPFANIAHGNSSILATKLALKLADYVITEGGFAADLGFEKFCDIVARKYNTIPSAVVLVASIRALHIHGGAPFEKGFEKNIDALAKGAENLAKHIDNMKTKFKVPPVVAINRFPQDDDEEIEWLRNWCIEQGAEFAVSEVFSKGGEGGIDLAKAVLAAIEKGEKQLNYIYELDDPVKVKIEKLAKQVYGADGVEYSPKALDDIKLIEKLGYANFPICMAKTQLSITDKVGLLGAPTGWKLNVDEVRLYTGAQFIVPVAGRMFLMPGLPPVPAAERMDIDENGYVVGLE